MKKQLLSIALLLSVGSSQTMMALIASQQKSIPKTVSVGKKVTVPRKKLKGEVTTSGPLTVTQTPDGLELYMSAPGQGTVLVDGKEYATVYGTHTDVSTMPTHVTVGDSLHAQNFNGARFKQTNSSEEGAGAVNITHARGKVKITAKDAGKVKITDTTTGNAIKTLYVQEPTE